MVLALVGRRLIRLEAAVCHVKNVVAALMTGTTLKRKRGTGRKKKRHPRTVKMLEREVMKYPFVTAKELKQFVEADLLQEVSV